METFAVLSNTRVPWVIEFVLTVVPTAAELPMNKEPCSTCKFARMEVAGGPMTTFPVAKTFVVVSAFEA